MERKNKPKTIEELDYYLNREINKLKEIFEKDKISLEKLNSDIKAFLMSYYHDALYFYEQKEKVKAFELVNYLWGMLDILANLNLIKVHNDVRAWFKIEQTETR